MIGSVRRIEWRSTFNPWVLASVAASTGFAIALAIMIVRNAADVPFFDEWSLVPYLRKSIDGELRAADLIAQDGFGPHRIAISRIILLVLARISGWNTNYELAVNYTLGCIFCALILTRAIATAKLLDAPDFALTGIVSSSLVLSFSQYENWLWGWQICVLSAASASSAVILLLTTQPPGYPRFVTALICAVVATFSYAIGLISWPLGLLAIALAPSPSRRRRYSMIVLWLAVFAAVMALYFRDFHFPPRRLEATGGDVTLIAYIKYVLIYIGSPLSGFSVNTAAMIGCLGLVIFFVVTIHAASSRFSFAPALYGYLLSLLGLASGMMTAIGRVQLGDFTALAPRYVTVANLFWIGLFSYAATVLWPILRRSRVKRTASHLLVVACAGFVVFTDVRALKIVNDHTHMKLVLRYKLLQGDRGESMKLLVPGLGGLGKSLEFLEQNKLWAWRPGAPRSLFEPPTLTYAESEFVRGLKFASGAGAARDYVEAFRVWTNAAGRDYPLAQYNLGVLYAQGLGVEQDYSKAAKWYLKAANRGVAEAQLSLAALYAEGIGVPKELGQAIKWYEKAAAQGLAEAQYHLGALYAGGPGVPPDYVKAFDAWTKASEQGHPRAQLNLGVMYANGAGVPRDEAKAASLYEKAARQGSSEAQFSLAEMFATGSGVRQNDTEAFAWFQVAVASGYERAAARRDEVAARMNDTQMVVAQELIRERTEDLKSVHDLTDSH